MKNRNNKLRDAELEAWKKRMKEAVADLNLEKEEMDLIRAGFIVKPSIRDVLIKDSRRELSEEFNREKEDQ